MEMVIKMLEVRSQKSEDHTDLIFDPQKGNLWRKAIGQQSPAFTDKWCF